MDDIYIFYSLIFSLNVAYCNRRCFFKKEIMINNEKDTLEYKRFLYAPTMSENNYFSLYDDANSDYLVIKLY